MCLGFGKIGKRDPGSNRLGSSRAYGWLLLRRLPLAPSPYLDVLEVKMAGSHRSDPSQTLKIGMEESGKVSFFSLVAFLNWTFTIRAI